MNTRGRDNKGELKMGLNLSMDRDMTPSPTMEETSTLLKVFNKDAWHNIPKCMVDIIEALIEASESNRYSLMENFKKNMNQFSTFDTKM